MQRTHSTRRRRFGLAALTLGLIGAGFAFAPRAEAVDPTDFKTLAQPKRVLETRQGFPGFVSGTTKPAGGSVTKVRVAGGETGVPADAEAVSVNVTGVESVGNDGYLTVWDCKDDIGGSAAGVEPDPPFTSNVNLTSNDIRPNAVIAEIGTGADDDMICIYTRNATHLLVDVNGYFPAGSQAANHINLPTPERILDTRPASLVNYDAGKPVAGQVVKIPALNPGQPQILNVTGVDATAPGWLTVWDCTDANADDNVAGLTEPDPPNVSAHYLHPGVIAANLVISDSDGLPARFDDQVCIFTSGGTHIVVDRVGTFPPASDFNAIAPRRIMETRGAPFDTTPDNAHKFPGGQAVSLPIDVAGITPGESEDATALALNVTATDSAAGYVTIYPCTSASDPANPPNASNLNLVAGQTRPNLVLTAIGSTDRICIYTQSPTHLVIDLVGYFTNLHTPPSTSSTSSSTSSSSTSLPSVG